MPLDRSQYCLNVSADIRAAMELIGRNQRGVVIITDEGDRLLATITDGDIRRALLAGCDLKTSIDRLLAIRKEKILRPTIFAAVGTPPNKLLAIMKNEMIRQIPLVDTAGRVDSVVTLEELAVPAPLDCCALILAGGFGSRLQPLTQHTIKPMLRIGRKPLLELTVTHLLSCGIREIYIATHFGAEQVHSHFAADSFPGAELRFLHEFEPLGTAGALSLMPEKKCPIVVVNGDVLCRVDYRTMLARHTTGSAYITMGVAPYEQTIPYGVVASDGDKITAVTEKPTHTFEINAGIYVVDPAVRGLVAKGQRADMPALIDKAVGAGKPVQKYSIAELWIDIGSIDQYSAALAAEENS